MGDRGELPDSMIQDCAKNSPRRPVALRSRESSTRRKDHRRLQERFEAYAFKPNERRTRAQVLEARRLGRAFRGARALADARASDTAAFANHTLSRNHSCVITLTPTQKIPLTNHGIEIGNRAALGERTD